MLLMSTCYIFTLFLHRRRVPKEAPHGGGQGEYMDDYGDEDEVHLSASLLILS